VVWQDLDAALMLAQRSNIKLILSYFDFYALHYAAKYPDGVQCGGRSNVFSESHLQDALINNVVIPILKRYGNHSAIFAHEVCVF